MNVSNDGAQFLEAIAGGGFPGVSIGKLNLSASHLERMKSVSIEEISWPGALLRVIDPCLALGLYCA